MKSILSKQNRALLSELVRTDFKLRYQGSALGYVWSLLRPLLLFCILYVVFVNFIGLGKDIPHFPAYLLFGIVLWNFFSEMTSQSLTAIVDRGDLIRKIRIPRWMIIAASSFSALINLGLNLVIVAVFMAVDGVQVSGSVIWLPFILAEIYIFSLGVSLLLATAFVKYRDVRYIWEVVLQALFYLTPILYELTRIEQVWLQKIVMLNPMAQAIQDARNVLITPQTITLAEVYGSAWMRGGVLLAVTAVFILGVAVFKRNAKYFAENL